MQRWLLIFCFFASFLVVKAEPNGSLYNAAIQGSCLRKEIDLARRFYVKMREIGLQPDGKTRAMMLQNLPRC